MLSACGAREDHNPEDTGENGDTKTALPAHLQNSSCPMIQHPEPGRHAADPAQEILVTVSRPARSRLR
jgi:hypothetical protein